ncbi:SDR family NAD(P)-dependent oxidoreductase [Rhodococcus sp. X156]|uniref:SDR family NAD(P)-dependent oxidoreductase n=1 Tax=Rhodococcus sp. X156 TaxID=2499145 RepID=UPI000FD90E6F|nr:SDR family NAD(P)-dependent oxidoreductase [Rhodococcus sp. X156]
MTHSQPADLSGRRILISGAARGIGAALARRLHERGARVALIGLEPELLAEVARSCGDAPWLECNVAVQTEVDAAVTEVVQRLGGLDVVVSNAGVAAQMPMLGGDPSVLERTLQVNVLGTYYLLRAAGPHISHDRGYAVAVSSLAAAVQAPLLGAYSASKAAVEALGNTLRVELAASGAKVGLAYFAELDTDMTSRGFGTEAATALSKKKPLSKVAPLSLGVDALERGIARRSRRVVAPGWVGPVLHIRSLAQRVTDRATQNGLQDSLRIARTENAPLTTAQPGDHA